MGANRTTAIPKQSLGHLYFWFPHQIAGRESRATCSFYIVDSEMFASRRDRRSIIHGGEWFFRWGTLIATAGYTLP